MANPLYYPVFRAFDSNGAPLAGGKVYTYEAGTSTPKVSYTDSTMTVQNTNPVILDAEGSAPIWVSGSYKINLTDANGVQQNDFPVDNFTNDAGSPGPAGTFQISAAGGTVDAITANYTPDVTLSNLTTVAVVALGANATTTPTFSPDGLTARTITKKGGVALVPGDIAGAGYVAILEYNSAGTRWELANPATTALPWVVSGGTANAITATYAPVIGTVYDGLILSFRASAANTTTTPTFSPNGLTARTITKKGGSALVAGDIAGNLAEYWLRYNLANTRWELLNPTGISGITDLSTVTIDPTADFVAFYDTSAGVYGKALANTIAPSPISLSFTSASLTIASATVGAVAHGLGVRPKIINVTLINTSAELGYSVGDEVLYASVASDAGRGLQIFLDDTTNVRWVMGSTTRILQKVTGDGAIDYTKWKMIIRAFA